VAAILSIFIPGKAETAGSKRAFMIPGRRFPNIVDDNPKSKGWKKTVALEVSRVWKQPLVEGPLTMTCTFYLLRPQSHANKYALKPSAPKYPIVKPDLLKLTRAIEDALTGVFYVDDAQIVKEIITKEYAIHRVGVALSFERTP
jgi:Holliday junction resolvase RusA-like endonuclease